MTDPLDYAANYGAELIKAASRAHAEIAGLRQALNQTREENASLRAEKEKLEARVKAAGRG